jgi:hypothetical protein
MREFSSEESFKAPLMVPCWKPCSIPELILREAKRPTKAQIAILADKAEYNPLSEAAFFYGLYLHGQSLDVLRQDIRVPDELLAKWARDQEIDEQFRRYLAQVYDYRQQVLAIFDTLVAEEQRTSLQ